MQRSKTVVAQRIKEETNALGIDMDLLLQRTAVNGITPSNVRFKERAGTI